MSNETSKYRLLLIEDFNPIAFLIKSLLEISDFIVDSVANGEKALILFKE